MIEDQTINRGPLIILGASARAAAQSAIRSGFRPYAIDLFADLDLQQIAPAVQIERYPVEFLAALAAAPQAPWIYTGSLENYPRLVERLAKLRPLVGNDAATLRQVRDPRWLAALLSSSPVRYPETVVGSQESGIRKLDSHFSAVAGEWLRKPVRSGGGMGITRVLTPDSRPLTPDVCFQRRVTGQSISASFVAVEGNVHWIGATEQWIGWQWGAPQEFQYAGSVAPLALTSSEQVSLLEVAQLIANEAGLNGLFGLDLIRDDQGLWLIEVNPRYTASMELFERLTDCQLLAEHFGMRTSHKSTIATKPRLEAKLIVYAKEADSVGVELHDTLIALEKDGIASADIPQIGTVFQPGNPICTLLTGGTSRSKIERTLLAAAKVVREALDH